MTDKKILHLKDLGSEVSYKEAEVWKCKSNYTDALGNKMLSEQDYFVYIQAGPYDDSEGEFVRVQLISTNVEHRSGDDILINDVSILDRPFIVETWNEQPMLTTVLDKRLGKIDIHLENNAKQESYTLEQLDFRKSEVRRAAYLYQSILSNLKWNEQKKSKKLIPIKYARMLSVAAVFIGVFLSVIQPGKLDNGSFLEKHSIAISIDDRSFVHEGPVTRGSAKLISGFSPEESEILLLGIDNYKGKEYSNAATLLGKVKGLYPKNLELYFYLGLSQYYAGESDKSILVLNRLSENQDFTHHPDVLFYLALAYVQNNLNRDARKTLKVLQKEYPEYYENKKDLLKDLRWFSF